MPKPTQPKPMTAARVREIRTLATRDAAMASPAGRKRPVKKARKPRKLLERNTDGISAAARNIKHLDAKTAREEITPESLPFPLPLRECSCGHVMREDGGWYPVM